LSGLLYSVRSLARTPASAAALVFTIAIGIGGKLTVDAFVRGLTGSPLPRASLQRMVSVFSRDPYRVAGPLTLDEYRALKGRTDIFEWMGAARVSQETVAFDGQSSVAPVAAVTPGAAAFLGISPGTGAVVRRRWWQAEFGSASLDSSVQIGGAEIRLAGAIPDSLEGLYRDHRVQVWTSLDEQSLDQSRDRGRRFWPLGRLRRDISPEKAQAMLALADAAPDLRLLSFTGLSPDLSSGLARVGIVLGLAARAVFFVACVNVALFFAVALSRPLS
jgi:hypothetical protein